MRLKFNAMGMMLAAFVGLVVAAGALLATQPEPRAHVLPAESEQGAAPSDPNAPTLEKPSPVAIADIPTSFAGAAFGTTPVEPSAPAPAATAAQAPAPAAQAGAVVPAAAHPARDDRFVIKRILPINGPIRYGEWHWDEAGVPAGPIVITVDLDARVLSVFRNGYEIGATAVLLGTQEKPTPLGVFPIIMKDKHHFSATYDHAPMPFTMRLTNDGVSIHGTKVEKGYASHGCVGVPDDFAAKLFAIAKLGDKVYITRGKMIGKGDSLIG